MSCCQRRGLDQSQIDKNNGFGALKVSKHGYPCMFDKSVETIPLADTLELRSFEERYLLNWVHLLLEMSSPS